jgi:hypothetical protein
MSGKALHRRENSRQTEKININLNIGRNWSTRLKQNKNNGGGIMKNMKLFCNVCAVVILALFFFSTTSAYAQDHQQRERWQQLHKQINESQAMINENVRDRSLTKPEAEHLRNELRRIESDMSRAGQDRISRNEMERLEREFAKLRKDIYREKKR